MIDRSELTDEPTDARIFCRRIAPLIGEAQTDSPDESEATTRSLATVPRKDIASFIEGHAKHPFAELLAAARAIEASGQTAYVKFARWDNGDICGLTLAVRV